MSTLVEFGPDERVEETPGGVDFLVGDDRDILARIHEPNVGMAIWQREATAALKNWLRLIARVPMPHGRVLIAPDEAQAALKVMLSGAGASVRAGASPFINDAAEIVLHFAEIAGCDLVDVRLEAVTHDACWKFHRDCVPFRLITTYIGPGTEYVAPSDAGCALDDQRDYIGPLNRVPTFGVAVFNGSSDPRSIGVVHRSPPIAGTGQRRLVLCLNAPSITSPVRWDRLLPS